MGPAVKGSMHGYEYMCSETDFTQEKSDFHPTSRIPNSSLLFTAALL